MKFFSIKNAVILLVLFLLISPKLFSQIPQKLTFQGKLTSASGNPVEGVNVPIKLELFDALPGGTGTSVWVASTFTNVTNGLYNISLTVTAPFDKPYFLETTFNSEVLSPRTEITASPYAFVASSATTAGTSLSLANSKVYQIDQSTLIAKAIMVSSLTVVGGNNGDILVNNGNGTLLWQANTAASGLPAEINNRIAADTAIGLTTASLRTDLTTETNNRIATNAAIGLSTASLKTDITNETSARISQDNTIAISTGLLQNQINQSGSASAVAASTTALQAQINNVSVATGSLKTDITNETNNRISTDMAIGLSTAAIAISTANLQTQINNINTNSTTVGLTTASLRTDLTTETNNRIATNAAIGLSTTNLQTQITNISTTSLSMAIGLTTASLRTDLIAEISSRTTTNTAIALSTTNLKTQIDAIANSTGTIIPTVLASSNTWTGINTFSNSNTIFNEIVSISTLTVTNKFKLPLGDSTTTPDDVGLVIYDIATGKAYISKGTSSSADWQPLW